VAPSGPQVLLLSARTAESLQDAKAALAAELARDEGLSLPDVAFTANCGRQHFSHRLAFVASSAGEAQEKLRQFARGQIPAGGFRAEAGHTPPPVAFLFSGQGAQYAGMARELDHSQPTFRRTLQSAGLNPYYLEMANIREQASWVHPSGEATTHKAMDLVAGAVQRVHLHKPLFSRKSPVEQSALVVGGGIAGIQAALDIADAGYKVYLVERDPSIGGRMAQLDKTFPTLDCAT